MIKSKRKNRSGLMRNSIMILTGVCLVIVITFFINNIIIHGWYKEEAVENRRSFFRQITEQIQKEENAIVNLTDSILTNNVVQEYLYANTLGERWEQLDDVKQFASGMMKLNGNIEGVCIRDEKGQVIAMQGIKYAPFPEEEPEDALQRFTNRISVSGENAFYFYAGVPIYRRTDTKSNDYTQTLYYTRTSSLQTLSYYTLSLAKSAQSAANLASSMSGTSASSVLTMMSEAASNYKTIELACMVISAIPLIVAYPFAQKYFEKGIMVGSVKG